MGRYWPIGEVEPEPVWWGELTWGLGRSAGLGCFVAQPMGMGVWGLRVGVHVGYWPIGDAGTGLLREREPGWWTGVCLPYWPIGDWDTGGEPQGVFLGMSAYWGCVLLGPELRALPCTGLPESSLVVMGTPWGVRPLLFVGALACRGVLAPLGIWPIGDTGPIGESATWVRVLAPSVCPRLGRLLVQRMGVWCSYVYWPIGDTGMPRSPWAGECEAWEGLSGGVLGWGGVSGGGLAVGGGRGAGSLGVRRWMETPRGSGASLWPKPVARRESAQASGDTPLEFVVAGCSLVAKLGLCTQPGGGWSAWCWGLRTARGEGVEGSGVSIWRSYWKLNKRREAGLAGHVPGGLKRLP